MDAHQQIYQQHEQQQQHQQQQPATRVVSHWAKSTPEEGIQVIFNRADTDRATSGVRILTSPTSLERPCQWDICLRLASSSSCLADSSSSPSKTTASSTAPSGARSSTPTTIAAPSRRPASQLQVNATPSTPYHTSTSPLLVLALQRVSFRLGSAGHGAMAAGDEGPRGFEDPMNPRRARCDSYRTIYIYSPRLRRDILVQPINREFWPQTVVFKCEDVLDEDHKYHFQIWLSGSSPRQTDAETDARTNQQRNLLFALRQDTTTCNVQINIKDPPPPLTVQQACLETASGSGSGIKKRAVSGGAVIGGGGGGGGGIGYSEGDNYNSHGHNSRNNNYNTPPTSTYTSAASSSCSNSTYEKHDSKQARPSKLQENHNNNNNHTIETIRATFWAHKTILESVSLFSRMLSCGRFKEGQPGPDGIYRISLSSDMFEPKIMDTLLDYVYTREPIHDDATIGDDSVGIKNKTEQYCRHDNNRNVYADDYESMSDPPVMSRHHHASANVALNLQAATSEPLPHRSHHPQFHPYSQSNTYKGSDSLGSFTPASGTTPSTTTQQPPPPTPLHIIPYADRHTHSIRTHLKPEDWFFLYRAAIHMEDSTLQTQALDKIQAQLNVQSALERALTWGPGYPEIKRVVLKYVFDERRAIFGDEEQNQLRPYLWPEIEEQVDVLVEITSKIARQ